MVTGFILADSSLLHLYRLIPLYYQKANGAFDLYKPPGVKLTDMRIQEKMYPKKLYIEEKNKVDAIREVQKEFNDGLKKCLRENNLTKAKNIVQNILKVTLEEPTSGSIEGVSKTVNILVGEAIKNRNLIKLLIDLSTTDYTTIRHSVNVMALTLGCANDLNYDRHKLKNIGLSALLHDVGKVRIKSELLMAPRKLSDNEFMEIKKHPIYGYNILTTCKFINKEIKMTALEHHERIDGSGYPNGTTNISEFAQIVSIVDCYEALTNDERAYRKAIKPLSALEIIKSEIVDSGKFPKEIYKVFAYSLLQIMDSEKDQERKFH